MPLFALLLLSALQVVPIEWRDSIRDVYVDGKLDRTAQTMTSASLRMVAVVCGEEVLLLDPEGGALSRVSKKDFEFAKDRTTAKSAALRGERIGAAVQPDGRTLLATADGRTILLTAHQSHAGPMTIEELYGTAPIWRAVADAYEPEPAVVEQLRAIDQPLTLQVVLATWCGDSRQHVPRLLKAIERAANSNITVELHGIGPDFTSPMALVQGENVTNVPTVIVRRGAREVGRFVETPAGATVESDIADIAHGTSTPHPGRYERGALLASGTYVHRDPRGRHAGDERIEVYERPGGGLIAHSIIRRRDGGTVDTWSAIDEARQTRFVEVTHRGSSVTRTRYRRDGANWAAHSRGARRGIVDQTVAMPPSVVTPSTITYAWASPGLAYVAPEDGVGAMTVVAFDVTPGDVLPKRVRFADRSERRLMGR